MKILLLNPPAENTIAEYQDADGSSFIETEDFGLFPPLGLLYVLSYLEAHTRRHQFYFKDCIAEHISHRNLAKVVDRIQPDIVGITSFTISLPDVCMAARTVRQAAPGAHICMGGHHPIAFPHESAKLKEFDSVIVGEGEEAFTRLVEAIERGDRISDVKGVYTADSINRWQQETHSDRRFLGSLRVPAGYIEDIDALPFPSRRFIRHINYQSVVGVSERLATIISSRGCPYRCTFCDVPYKRYRKRRINSVVDEIESCLDMGYREFHFYDDLFNITPSRVMDFCAALQMRGLRFPWSFRGRVNSVTRDSLAAAKQAGCRLISFGVETGTDEGLKQLRKGTSIQQIENVFRWCHELNIKTLADFMLGLPFEKSRSDVLRNIDFLIRLNPDYAQFSILSLYPNTELFSLAIQKGLLPATKWSDFAGHPSTDVRVDHWNEHLSNKELVALQKTAYRKYYLRPTYILKNVLKTASLYEFKTKVRGFLKLLH